jgi:hypothetical protein
VIKDFFRALVTLISLFCIIASSAAFTPAVMLAFLIMCISGVAAVFGQVNFAVINLALTSIAIGISPATDMEHFGHSILLACVYTVPFIIGFGGVLYGVTKLQRNVLHNKAFKTDS